jgi:hypothetical protein
MSCLSPICRKNETLGPSSLFLPVFPDQELYAQYLVIKCYLKRNFYKNSNSRTNKYRFGQFEVIKIPGSGNDKQNLKFILNLQ